MVASPEKDHSQKMNRLTESIHILAPESDHFLTANWPFGRAATADDIEIRMNDFEWPDNNNAFKSQPTLKSSHKAFVLNFEAPDGPTCPCRSVGLLGGLDSSSFCYDPTSLSRSISHRRS
jgi:hypothetical protein